MSAANRCVVTMHFDDGTQFSDWISFSMRDCYTDPLGELQFVAAPTRANRAEYRKHLKKGHLVTIKIDGVTTTAMLVREPICLIESVIYDGDVTPVDPTTYRVYNLARHDEMVTPFAGALEALVPSCEMIDARQISTDVLAECLSVMDEALREINRLRKRLRKGE